jgi:hypothetical protein
MTEGWNTPHSNPAALRSPFAAKVSIPWLWLHVIALGTYLGTPDFIVSESRGIKIHNREPPRQYSVDFAENTAVR